jgi:hypothetical protein
VASGNNAKADMTAIVTKLFLAPESFILNTPSDLLDRENQRPSCFSPVLKRKCKTGTYRRKEKLANLTP